MQKKQLVGVSNLNGQPWEVFDIELEKGEIFFVNFMGNVVIDCKTNCDTCPWHPQDNCIVGPRNILKQISLKYPEEFI